MALTAGGSTKLVDYGAGEVSDRLTILSLKCLYGTEAGKDTAHFEAERSKLLSQIRARTLNGKWFESVLALAAVNAAIWRAEDELRDIRQRVAEQDSSQAPVAFINAGRTAFRIQAMNDQRADLIVAINKDAGDATGMEKLT